MNTMTMTKSPKIRELENGTIISGEHSDEYHSNSAISNSKLKTFNKSRELFRAKHIDGTVPDKYGDAQSLGSQVHSYLVEGPDEFFSQYCPMPDRKYSLASKEGQANYKLLFELSVENGTISQDEMERAVSIVEAKKRYDEDKEWLRAIIGSRFVSSEQLSKILAMNRAVKSNMTADSLLNKNAEAEVTFRTNKIKSFADLVLQCRTDIIDFNGCNMTDGEAYAADLKSIDDVDNFELRYFNFGYYRQGPFYSSVINYIAQKKIKRFFFIFVEKNPPYRCRVYEPDPSSWQVGRIEVEQDLENLAECRNKMEYIDEQSVLVRLPEWAERQKKKELGIS